MSLAFTPFTWSDEDIEASVAIANADDGGSRTVAEVRERQGSLAPDRFWRREFVELSGERIVAAAFGGGALSTGAGEGRFAVGLHLPDLQRPLAAHELSDGQMRYLCILAALLSPRPAALIALNEPESNLHPSLLGPLADLIAHAADLSQVWITTHSFELAELVQKAIGTAPIRLTMEEGETRREGMPKGRYFQAVE